MKAERPIKGKHLKRAAKVPDNLLGPYMEQVVQELEKAVDYWRLYDGPSEQVDLALDTFLALWTEAGVRGMR